jgi:CBS domain-containing protein
MKVKKLMSAQVYSCQPDTDLAKAGWLMWEKDCGALPVVKDSRVVGIVTDRDICMAAATKSRACHDIRVSELLGEREIALVRPEDDIDHALDVMSQRQIRRVPVVDDDGSLVGLLSLIDVARAVDSNSKEDGPGPDRVVDVLAAISEPAASFANQA